MLRSTLLFIILIAAVDVAAAQTPSWYAHYQRGERLMKSGEYQDAALSFMKAILEKGVDSDRERLSGTRTVPYYPRRELGVCLYQLGIRDFAAAELRRSMSQSPTDRAVTYLNKINR